MQLNWIGELVSVRAGLGGMTLELWISIKYCSFQGQVNNDFGTVLSRFWGVAISVPSYLCSGNSIILQLMIFSVLYKVLLHIMVSGEKGGHDICWLVWMNPLPALITITDTVYNVGLDHRATMGDLLAIRQTIV